MRKSFLLIASLILATGAVSTANAETEWGLGFLSYEVPIGVFVGVNEQATIHAAFDYDKIDKKNDPEYETEFAFLAALVWDFWHGENWGFGVSPGVMYRTLSPVTGDSDSFTAIPIRLTGHWNPASNVSFWFSHGLDIVIASPGDPDVDSTTNFFTNGDNLGMFGFTIWAP